MSEESLFMIDTPVGDGNGSNRQSQPQQAQQSQLPQQHVTDFLSAGADLDQYDLGDPFSAGANMEDNFAGNFLDSHGNSDSAANFSLDPTSIANEFTSNLLSSYDTTHETHNYNNYHNGSSNTSNGNGNGVDSNAQNNTHNPFDTVSMSHRDSPFDVSQFQLADHQGSEMDHPSNEHLSNDHMSNEEMNQNSNGEEQEDSQQPRRSRATGEALALLISEFSKNINPNSAIRKQLADATGMSERSVRIWFQNRRAKAKKMEKMHKDGDGNGQRNYANSYGGSDSYNYNKVAIVGGRNSMSSLQQQTKIPITINENYCLVDCNSISIGTWQRIKSGYINSQILKNLINLSPKFLNSLMFTTDLLIILSKKNKELNYFFSGFFQNNKILFRIFYPLENILSCSLLNQQQAIGDSKESSVTEGAELRLTLSSSPKFAVFFLNNTNTGRENTNQWSICDDFSEGQQVNNAFVGEGGGDTPHILNGADHDALQFLNTYILQYHQQQAAAAQQQQQQALPQQTQDSQQERTATSAQPSDMLVGEGDDLTTSANDMMNVAMPDDFSLESLGNVGDIGGSDNLLGF